MWATLRLAHIPAEEQNQKKRTFDVLPNRTTSFVIDSGKAKIARPPFSGAP
jgi:hypothetical protein